MNAKNLTKSAIAFFVLTGLYSNAIAGSDKPEKKESPYVLQENFDDFFRSGFATSLHHKDNASIVYNKGVENSKALIVYYQGYDRGSERVIETTPLGASLTHASLEFEVMFCEGFDFARGGKLHGLAPEQPVTGGNPIHSKGWSARAMWGKDGSLKTYIYHQDMKGKYGDVQVAKGFKFEPGRYYNVRYNLILNQPADSANGSFSIDIDDKTVVEHKNLRFRGVDSPATQIRQFMFNTFHGGSSPEWAPRDNKGNYKRDCAYFDNITVTTEVY